jgi:predicted choloylglycine hydrolase
MLSTDVTTSGRSDMNRDYNLVNGKFQHIILEGTAYEVGKLQGEILKNDEEMRARIEKAISSFLSQLGVSKDGKPDLKTMGFQDFKELQGFFEEHCPGLNEEMQGFADSMGVEVNEVPFYDATYHVPKNCSQVAVLSSVTNDKHVYVGRSYEWTHTEDDLRLCTTRVKGKAKHIGFSTFLFGRADGLNEHGVSVTFTGGGIFGVPYKQQGFGDHLVIRSILDSCESVDDAMELVQKIPISGFFNLLIADRSSNAALVEFADETCDIKQINNNSEDKYLFSTNHYTLPGTIKSNELNCGIIGQSRKRYQLLASNLCAASEVKREALRTILSRKFPKGLCDHYYSESFGTVWSLIFDLTSIKADVCFGAPTHNKWRSFSIDGPIGVKEYPAVFPDAIGKWPY